MIGKLLDRRYRIVEYLGAGSFGKTYLAEDIRRPGHPRCAIKHLRPTRNTPKALQAARRRFQREVVILEKLGRKHDQIPLLLASFEAKQDFFIVEDFIPGSSLATELIAGQPWSEEQTIRLLEEILEILEFVHSEGVIHRDVTPFNLIRRQPDGKLVLIDFGAVKEITADFSQPPALRTIATGTPAYMPLEQFQGHPQFNSDIYAVGTIAIQALSGVTSKQLAKLKNPGDSQSNLPVWLQKVEISQNLALILQKMIEEDFHQRYQSAAEVLADLTKMTRFQLNEIPETIIERPQIPSAETKMPMPINNWFSGDGADSLLRSFCVAGIAVLLAGSLAWLFESQTHWRAAELYRRGRDKAQRGDHTAALEDYTQAIQLQPDDADAYNSRGVIRLQLQDYQGAKEDFSQAIRLKNSYDSAYNHRCQALLNLGKLEDSLSDCTRALEINPNSGEAYKNRCAVHFALGAYQRGIEDCNRAVELNNQDWEAYNNRGLVRSGTQEHQAAVEDFVKALQLNPKQVNSLPVSSASGNSNAYKNRCIAQVNVSNFDGAIFDCTEALKLNPSNGSAYENRCAAYFNKASYQKAIEDCNRAIEINSNGADAYHNRGLVRFALGDKKAALQDFNRAVELKPDNAVFLSNRANAYYELADYKKAILDYSLVLGLVPNFNQAYYRRGLAFMQLGDKPAAIEDFKKSAKLCADKNLSDCYNNSLNLIKKIQD